VKSSINSVEVHLQLSNNEHPVDGALVGVGSLWLGSMSEEHLEQFSCFVSIFKPSEIHLYLLALPTHSIEK
jgi:hypothetical protein